MTLMDAVLHELEDASPRRLTNQEIYKLPDVAKLLVNYQDEKSMSGGISNAIKELKKRGKDICGNGRNGWFICRCCYKSIKRSILSSEKNYTFSDFFELAYPTEDIVKEFGYAFSDELLDLPKEDVAEDAVAEFKIQIIKNIPKISLNSEAARREFMIAPVLLHLLKFAEIKISSE